MRLEGSGAAFCQLQTVSLLSLFVSPLPISDSLSAGSQPLEAKPCKASDEHACPDKPPEICNSARAGRIRHESSNRCNRGAAGAGLPGQPGRAMPTAQLGWGPQSWAEVQLHSQGAEAPGKVSYSSFSHGCFSQYFIFDTLFAKELNCYIPFGTGKSEANTVWNFSLTEWHLPKWWQISKDRKH